VPGEQDEYGWIELAAKLPKGGMARNEYVRADDGEAIRCWRERHGNTDVYGSICRFKDRDRSSEYVCDFFLDVDANDLELARQEALGACQLLIDRLGVDPDSLDLSFSGAKGFHVVVPRLVFGDPVAADIMALWRSTASRMAKEGLSHLDLAVYQKSRLWRLANSVNSKTGLYKIPLEYKEFTDLGLDYALDLARQPRDYDCMVVPTESCKAVAWVHKGLEWVRRERERARLRRRNHGTPWILPPCIRAIESCTLEDGIRHEAYFQYARFMATVGAAPEEILRRLTEIDSRHSIGDDRYLARLARTAVKYSGFRTCPKETLASFCDPQVCSWIEEEG